MRSTNILKLFRQSWRPARVWCTTPLRQGFEVLILRKQSLIWTHFCRSLNLSDNIKSFAKIRTSSRDSWWSPPTRTQMIYRSSFVASQWRTVPLWGWSWWAWCPNWPVSCRRLASGSSHTTHWKLCYLQSPPQLSSLPSTLPLGSYNVSRTAANFASLFREIAANASRIQPGLNPNNFNQSALLVLLGPSLAKVQAAIPRAPITQILEKYQSELLPQILPVLNSTFGHVTLSKVMSGIKAATELTLGEL